MCASSSGFSLASGWKCTVMVMSNSPHPVSVTSYGGLSTVRVGCLNDVCSPNTTLDTTWLRS